MDRATRKDFLLKAGTGLALLAGSTLLGSCSGIRRKDIAESTKLPTRGITKEAMSILSLASLAPSGHNTQPWTVTIGSARRWIIGSDRARWLPGVDPENRELMLSLGAFIEALTIAAALHGLDSQVKVLAKSPFDTTVASIEFGARGSSVFTANALETRRTVKKGHLSDPIGSSDFRKITHDSPDYIDYIDSRSPKGKNIADLTIEANRIQAWRDDAQEELSRWIRFDNSEARKFRDGLTPESMEITGLSGFIVRTFFDASSVTTKTFREQTVDMVNELVSSYGGWVIVSSPDSSVGSLIDTGRRFLRMGLRVRERMIALHPMTQSLEEKDTAAEAGTISGSGGKVQFILRAGYLSSYPEPVSLRMPPDRFTNA